MARFVGARPYGDEVWYGKWCPSPYRRAYSHRDVRASTHNLPSWEPDRSLMCSQVQPTGRGLKTGNAYDSRDFRRDFDNGNAQYQLESLSFNNSARAPNPFEDADEILPYRALCYSRRSNNTINRDNGENFHNGLSASTNRLRPNFSSSQTLSSQVPSRFDRTAKPYLQEYRTASYKAPRHSVAFGRQIDVQPASRAATRLRPAPRRHLRAFDQRPSTQHISKRPIYIDGRWKFDSPELRPFQSVRRSTSASILASSPAPSASGFGNQAKPLPFGERSKSPESTQASLNDHLNVPAKNDSSPLSSDSISGPPIPAYPADFEHRFDPSSQLSAIRSFQSNYLSVWASQQYIDLPRSATIVCSSPSTESETGSATQAQLLSRRAAPSTTKATVRETAIDILPPIVGSVNQSLASAKLNPFPFISNPSKPSTAPTQAFDDFQAFEQQRLSKLQAQEAKRIRRLQQIEEFKELESEMALKPEKRLNELIDSHQYHKLNITELKAVLRQRDILYTSNTKKSEMIDKLEQYDSSLGLLPASHAAELAQSATPAMGKRKAEDYHVTPSKKSKVDTTDKSKVDTTDKSKVDTTDKSKVRTTDKSKVRTTDKSRVRTTDKSKVTTTDKSKVDSTNKRKIRSTKSLSSLTPVEPVIDKRSEAKVSDTVQDAFSSLIPSVSPPVDEEEHEPSTTAMEANADAAQTTDPGEGLDVAYAVWRKVSDGEWVIFAKASIETLEEANAIALQVLEQSIHKANIRSFFHTYENGMFTGKVTGCGETVEVDVDELLYLGEADQITNANVGPSQFNLQLWSRSVGDDGNKTTEFELLGSYDSIVEANAVARDVALQTYDNSDMYTNKTTEKDRDEFIAMVDGRIEKCDAANMCFGMRLAGADDVKYEIVVVECDEAEAEDGVEKAPVAGSEGGEAEGEADGDVEAA